MKQSLVIAGALALGFGALVTGAVGTPPAARGQEDGAWLNSYPAAQEAARQAGKPIFLVFR